MTTQKSTIFLEKFLAESEPHTPSLRSGSVRRLAHGEHRVWSVEEDMPFEVSLEPERNWGLNGNETLALKTFHSNVNE